MSLSDEQRHRYARQLALPEIGAVGQKKLLASRVLIVGLGGLGSPAAFYLAAAGVGTLGLMDADLVEASNLQRQILHATPDLGRAKIESAAEKLSRLNPDVHLLLHARRLTRETTAGLLSEYDFVIDATDNFVSKFLIPEICHAAGRAYSHAGIQGYVGQTLTVLPGRTACHRCVFEGPPPPDPAPPRGPLGVVPGVLGTIQATEAIKYLLGIGQLLTNRLLVYDALALSFRILPFARNPFCPLCSVSSS